MAVYTIDDLNETLFTAIEKVMEGTMDLERAEKIAALGQTIVNAAKVQVDFCKHHDGAETPAFFKGQQRTKVLGRS